MVKSAYGRFSNGMKIAADLHIHSKFSRAVSKEMTLENLDTLARKKGINVLGTGDFTHPQWFREIKAKLEPSEAGLYKLKGSDSGTRFILTVEISNIYTKNKKGRRVHNLIFVPTIEAAEKINERLGWQGNLRSDGRPILGLDSKELLKIVLDIEPRSLFVPAHAWTPWFSIFGSMSGFDSIEECFDEYSKYIYAIETGLSSDPAMNWRLSKLDKIALISNSDSHSLERIGREANVFDCELSYDAIVEAIKSKNPKKFLYTIEFFPEEGKYHYDGHRLCNFSQDPAVTKEKGKICPVCKRPMTIGVLYRVEELADRPSGTKPANAVPFKSLVTLDKIIGDALGVGEKSKAVQREYESLIQKFGNELAVLLDVRESDLKSATDSRISEGILKVREGKVKVTPGYDGEYGKISIFNAEDLKVPQESLF